jgi:hypothetical protein
MENPYLQSHTAGAAGGYLKPRDTRPIEPPWQREKSVKIMKSLKGRAFAVPMVNGQIRLSGTV